MITFSKESVCLLLPPPAEFAPRSVTYLHSGGKEPGVVVSRFLELPLYRIDIRYPISRSLENASLPGKIAGMAVKELLYRTTEPEVCPGGCSLPPAGDPTLLVDDSASSGKTLKLAIRTLAENGIEPRLVKTLVVRCGKGAQSMVDYYLFD